MAKSMRHLSAALLIAFLCAGSLAPARAGSAFAQGLKAYDSRDYQKAFALWLPLARGSDMAAQRNIAHMLRRGLGVRRDPKRALAFYERAAEAGLVSAALNAGIMRLAGDGVPCDTRRGLRWIQWAAESGHPEAQFYMGRIYEKGYAVRPDKPRAIGWYWIAMKGGSLRARRRLDAIMPSETQKAQQNPNRRENPHGRVPK